MESNVIIPDPEKKLNIAKRYLHILALLQNNKDPVDWNGTTLANVLSLDENKTTLSDKSIRDYINKNLIEEFGLNIDIDKGARRIELGEEINDDMLEKIITVYSSFVVTDSTKDVVLKNLIKKHPTTCLWILAKIYFATIEKKRIEFDYTTNTGYKIHKCLLNPYHMVFRNNNLYLVGKNVAQDNEWMLIINKMENLKVTDQFFDDDIPSPEEIFKDTLGSFIGKKHNVKIRFKKNILEIMEQVLSILEPEVKELDGGNEFEADFTVSDDKYLCKQLFLYGGDVEILEPKELRETMISMLTESVSVYE